MSRPPAIRTRAEAIEEEVSIEKAIGKARKPGGTPTEVFEARRKIARLRGRLDTLRQRWGLGS